MLSFLTPSLWQVLIWANIIVGGTWAAYCVYRDLSGPARFPDDESSYSSGPSGPSPEQ